MPTPSSSDPSRRGRPARPGRPAGGGAKGAGRPGAPSGRGGAADSRGRGSAPARRGDRPSEGPAWKKRAEAREADDTRGKAAGWGGVARRGAGRIRDEGAGSGAAAAFREASGAQAWEPEVWIDEGDVRDTAEGAVGRGRSTRAKRAPVPEDDTLAHDPTLARAVGPTKIERVEAKLRDAGRAFRRGRYEEAKKILKPVADVAPTAASVRELLGLSYYRLGRWKLAIKELEAFADLGGTTEQNPVLADCYRALGRHAKVAELWEDLREASPSGPLVAEGRIVYAGSLADQGRLQDAIAVLEAAKHPTKRPKEHHLRVTYALADLHERAGDVPRARQLFTIVASADPELGDVEARLRALR